MSQNADVLWFIGIVGLFNLIALTFLAIRLRAPIVIHVAPPTAVLPEQVQRTLDAIDAKLVPAKVKLYDEQVSTLVYEAVALAENSKLKGVDRFRLAKQYVLERVRTLNADVEERDIAQRIEAAVAVGKHRK